MTAPADVLVVGGGIAGLTSALALADAGWAVRVVDDALPGGASRASAGMLGASLGFGAAVAPLALAARDLYPAFLERLHAASGIAVPLDRRGIIEVAADDDELARLHASLGEGSQPLDRLDLVRFDTRLGRHPGGALHQADGYVDNVRLLDALTVAAARHPRVALCVGTVIALGQPTCAFLTSGERVMADRIVIAGGAWAGHVAGLPRPLPVRPLRGELCTLAGDAPPRVIVGAGGYLIPRAGGVLVGATSEDAGFTVRTTSEGGDALARVAMALASLAPAPMTAHWSGLRPMTPDGLPLLGVDAEVPWLAYATGYSRNGILFAPWAAGRLAAEMGGGRVAELDPFRLERFDTP